MLWFLVVRRVGATNPMGPAGAGEINMGSGARMECSGYVASSEYC